FSLPEVTVIGRRPTSSEDPFKWPFGDMPSESPKALPGLDDFFFSSRRRFIFVIFATAIRLFA
ncbi:hypothetical protein ACIXFX_09240, partial [Bacteroides fragilis]